ncbi:Probable RNA-binding protein YqeI [Linum grandiflorum]
MAAMASSISTSSAVTISILRRLLRSTLRHPTFSASSSRSICSATAEASLVDRRDWRLNPTSSCTTTASTATLLQSHSAALFFSNRAFSSQSGTTEEVEEEENDSVEEGSGEDLSCEGGEGERLSSELVGNGDHDCCSSSEGKVLNLTVREKKELASYAHSLGKKLKSQLVGKSGVTENVAAALIASLEANELIKIKIHKTCPEELEDVVQQLEELPGSTVVSRIGRTMIVYKPSIAKQKAEERRRQVREAQARIQQENVTQIRPPFQVVHEIDENAAWAQRPLQIHADEAATEGPLNE